MGTIRPQIVLFGDSNTEWSYQVDLTGWGALLANHYMRKADVINRGFGGYTTLLAQFLLDKVFPIPSSTPPLLATVSFGANDASDPVATHGMLHVSLEEYAENLRKIIAHIKKQSASTHIVLIAPPAIDSVNLLKHAPTMFGDTTGVPTRTDELVKTYADECVKVAKDAGLPVINLWSIMHEASDWQKYLWDGLHLSAAGNALVFEELVKVLDDPSFKPTLKADEMPWDYPHFLDFSADPASDVKSWINPYSK
ncbi:unnamed protein product [Calypogeia fissa]